MDKTSTGMMLTSQEISDILQHFGLTFHAVTGLHDTSRGENDRRFNYILDNRYVLKIHSVSSMWEERLLEIHRLIHRYRSIDIYCPALFPTLSGTFSCPLEHDGHFYTCFVEEYAAYPVCEEHTLCDRSEVVEHLGLLAAKYTNIDLSHVHSMWSIIDLAPLDVAIDEKQENTNLLVQALYDAQLPELAQRLTHGNTMLRDNILTVFDRLPRCVFQGDLNNTNELHDGNGHFAGLIDFNLSGTDVNINVFLNETNAFPEDETEFDRLSIPELLVKMDEAQDKELAAIFRHYTMNEEERFAFPYYRKIVQLFQYPNVCLMKKWLKEDSRREKCVQLIQGLLDKPPACPII